MSFRAIMTLLLFLLTWTASGSGQVVVIANESVPVDTLKKRELLDFYTGDVRLWGDKQTVVVFDLKPKGEAKKKFYKFIGKSSSRMKSIWLKNMLSGEGDAPESLPSEEALLQKVATTPGAIGYLTRAKAGKDVKIILTIK